MCPLLCATNQLTYANDAAIIASTNASLTKATSMNHSMSISRDDTASPDAFVLVDVEQRTRASSHRYVMCVFLARRRIQPHPSKRRIDAASKYRYTCLSLFAVDRCSGQYASCRCPVCLHLFMHLFMSPLYLCTTAQKRCRNCSYYLLTVDSNQPQRQKEQ